MYELLLADFTVLKGFVVFDGVVPVVADPASVFEIVFEVPYFP